MTLELTATQLTEPGRGRPLLVVGPSLGTSVTALWSGCAQRLADQFHVVGWDLPGHGRSATVRGPITMGDLAAGVSAIIDALGAPVYYAGDSVGGAVGLQLLLDHPELVTAAVIVSSGAKIGEASGWRERAELVATAGTPVMVEGSARRWFAPGFLDRDPETATGLLHSLQDTERFGYAAVCDALAAFDVRERLAEIRQPVLVATGEADEVTPVELGRQIADQVMDGTFRSVADAAHLPPAEQPGVVAALMTDFFARTRRSPVDAPSTTLTELYDAGLAVRREVLGDAHVDRATAAADDFTAEFQTLITRYAWGTIWTRPGLDRRSRSLITLTALVARGHHEELAMHVKAALRNGLTAAEIKELLLQTAIYCGVPDANTAFRIARTALAEARADPPPDQPDPDQPDPDRPDPDRPDPDRPDPSRPDPDQPDQEDR